jgi:hypothetical protein
MYRNSPCQSTSFEVGLGFDTLSGGTPYLSSQETSIIESPFKPIVAPSSGANKILSLKTELSQYPWPNMEYSNMERKDPGRDFAMAPIGGRTTMPSGEKVSENWRIRENFRGFDQNSIFPKEDAEKDNYCGEIGANFEKNIFKDRHPYGSIEGSRAQQQNEDFYSDTETINEIVLYARDPKSEGFKRQKNVKTNPEMPQYWWDQRDIPPQWQDYDADANDGKRKTPSWAEDTEDSIEENNWDRSLVAYHPIKKVKRNSVTMGQIQVQTPTSGSDSLGGFMHGDSYPISGAVTNEITNYRGSIRPSGNRFLVNSVSGDN